MCLALITLDIVWQMLRPDLRNYNIPMSTSLKYGINFKN